MPAARLALLSMVIEQVRATPTPAVVQWSFFGGSIALFLLLGSLLWSLQFAAILFGVVAFHECGHYLAMRAFGYRNVQMLLLPLVGGVTIGFESNPSAAQRAWMSLMGPLPGIVLGWLLLAAAMLLRLGEGWAWLHQLAVVMLAVNYLNILPVPPLDGGRVVQALLPARWIGAQAVFVGVACVLGAAAAWGSGFPALALIAFLTLFTLPALWQTRRVVRTLLTEGAPPASLSRVLRIKNALEVFERHALPMKQPQARILQAESALRAVDTASMRWRQRLVLGLVYGLLLSVPLAGIAGYLLILRPSATTALTPSPTAKVYDDALNKASAQAAGMDIQALARDLRRDEEGSALAPAGEQDIVAAEARLGVKLPADLRALYLASDGLPELQLAPLQRIIRTGPAELKLLLAGSADGRVQVFAQDEDAGKTEHWANREQLSHTLKLGPPAGDDDDEGPTVVLLDLNDPPLVAGRYLLEGSGGAPLSALDLRHSLEEHWAQQQAQAAAQQETARLNTRRREALQGEDMTRLLGHLSSPGLRERLLSHAPALPSPADPATLAAAEHKLGRPLPDDLRTLLAVHDGVPKLSLVAAEHYVLLPKARELSALRPPPEAHGQIEFKLPGAAQERNKARLDLDALDGCAIVGAVAAGRRTENLDVPTVLWCPQLAALGLQALDLSHEEAFPDFTALVRERIARQTAAEAAL